MKRQGTPWSLLENTIAAEFAVAVRDGHLTRQQASCRLAMRTGRAEEACYRKLSKVLVRLAGHVE